MSQEIIGNELFLKEVVAGSIEEVAVVKELVGIFKEFADWVKVFNTPVVSWREIDCVLEIEGELYECRSLPPTIESEVEGRLTSLDEGINHATPPGSVIGLANVRGGWISLGKIVDYAIMKQFSALVVYDERLEGFKRDVISSPGLISNKIGLPTPIPVVSVDRRVAEHIRNLDKPRARLKVKTRLDTGAVGKSVVAGVNGGGERELHITAHHDHWFKGYYDDLAGLESLIRSARELRGRKLPFNLVFISFTASEFGAPHLPSLFWSWGSRYLIDTLWVKNSLDRVLAAIVLDEFTDGVLRVSSSLVLNKCAIDMTALGQAVYEGSRYLPYTDAYGYTVYGIPVLAVHNVGHRLEIGHYSGEGLSGAIEVLTQNISRLVTEAVRCISRLGSDSIKSLLDKFFRYERSDLKYLAGKVALMVSHARDLSVVSSILRSVSPTVVRYEPSLEVLNDVFEDINTLLWAIGLIQQGYTGYLKAYLLDGEPLLNLYVNDYNREVAENILGEVLKIRIGDYLHRLRESVARLKDLY
ncbi:hypothetical protein ACSU1N_04495 [Thermogladius sp. 4427co]|uniref:hypothetical protein n=1 Tax=Thermogladius sp. 4427co TaxID=3450718 RepID=UPI003F78EEEA